MICRDIGNCLVDGGFCPDSLCHRVLRLSARAFVARTDCPSDGPGCTLLIHLEGREEGVLLKSGTHVAIQVVGSGQLLTSVFQHSGALFCHHQKRAAAGDPCNDLLHAHVCLYLAKAFEVGRTEEFLGFFV